MLCAKYDYKMDIAVKQEEAYEDGMNAGIEKGIHKNAIENAKNFLKEGIPVETIARCVGLPLEEVQTLADELHAQEKQ